MEYEWVLDRLVLGSAISSINEIGEGLWIITTACGASYILRSACVNVETGLTGKHINIPDSLKNIVKECG